LTSATLILLVNDIPDHLVGYHRALVDYGFRVVLARSGTDALRRAEDEVPECAVIDLRLPDMNGWDLCARLKAGPDRARIRIIVLTPDVSKICASEGAKAGCNAWLTHSTAAHDLIRTIRHVLQLDAAAPSSDEEALVSRTPCPACDSYEIRPTLRIGLVQYYCCRRCNFCWRVEALESTT
jgi:CheY-like chemotaxis protein